MSTPQMSVRFAREFRSRLVSHVEVGARRRRRRFVWGAGVAAVLVLGGAAGATASGLLPLPGAPVVTELGTERSGSFSGSGTLEIGPAPVDAGGVSIAFACASAGTFGFPDGGSVVCAVGGDGDATTILPLDAVAGGGITITAPEDAVWTLTASYVAVTPTEWGRNDAGETYGVIRDGVEPDLIAVRASNGRDGYVRRVELEAADGTAAARGFRSPDDALAWQEERGDRTVVVPVYDSDGITRIGDFPVGG